MALNNRQEKKGSKIKKLIRAHRPPPPQPNNVNQPTFTCIFLKENSFFQGLNEETYVPLAAKDSGWVDLHFHDANKAGYSQVQGDADDEITIEIVDGDSKQQSPMSLLFPNLNDDDLTQKTSPTDITRMLVGKKPNMKCLNVSKRAHFFQVS